MASAPEPPSDADTAPIPVLVKRLLSDGELLARAELRLAQAQATSQVRAAVPGIIAILVGGIFVLASLFTMLAALIAWLAPVLGAGNAALVVTLGTAAVGGIAIALGSHHLNKRAVVPPVRHLPDLTGSTPQEEVK